MNISFHLQDKNAGNLGDYLKHFYLLRLISRVMDLVGVGSVAYIDTHAGAGVYAMEEKHWNNRERNRKIINDRPDEWGMFDRLNPDIDKKIYLGSFVLVGRLLSENNRIRSKMLIFEKNKATIERIKKDAVPLLPKFNLGPFGPSTLRYIEESIISLKSEGYENIICLIDPFSANREWSKLLNYEDGCFVLMFDFSKIKEDEVYKWNCPYTDALLTWREEPFTRNKAYALFANRNARRLLKD